MKLLLYCTKTKPYLFESITTKGKYMLDNDKWFNELNGKIVAECDFEVEKITTFKDYTGYEEYDIHYQTAKRDYERLLQETCLNNQKLDDYLQGENGYAIHIKNLHIFDKPKELNDYYTFNGIVNNINSWETIDKAPQNMMYAYELISELGFSGTYMHLKKNILISIRSQWLCKILNGEKTIEIRKKVLRGMLDD